MEIKPHRVTRTFSISIDMLASYLLLKAGEEIGRFDLGDAGAEVRGSRPPRGDGFYLDVTIPESS